MKIKRRKHIASLALIAILIVSLIPAENLVLADFEPEISILVEEMDEPNISYLELSENNEETDKQAELDSLAEAEETDMQPELEPVTEQEDEGEQNEVEPELTAIEEKQDEQDKIELSEQEESENLQNNFMLGQFLSAIGYCSVLMSLWQLQIIRLILN